MIRDNWLVQEASKFVMQWTLFILGHTFLPDKDIVVITGGSNGLGKAIVLQLNELNARVAVLDICNAAEFIGLSNVNYYYCDVSNVSQLITCQAKIKTDIGTPSVLINNAGIAVNNAILDMLFEDIDRVIKVNLLLNFYTTKIFLPDMMIQNRGYVVTVSSVLGLMSPANLSAYGASKSGQFAFHESLTYEVGPPLLTPKGVKTLLVCPGQMQTSMFLNVETPLNILAPKLKIEKVAKKIIHSLEVGKRGEIRLPFYARLIPFTRAAPWGMNEITRLISGVDYYARASSVSDPLVIVSDLNGSSLSAVEIPELEGQTV